MVRINQVIPFEKRKFERRKWNVILAVISEGPERRNRLNTVETIDISYDGISLVSKQQYNIDDRLTLLMPRSGILIKAKVTRTWRHAEGTGLGMQFEQILSPVGCEIESELFFAA